jgi:hypothetical protein
LLILLLDQLLLMLLNINLTLFFAGSNPCIANISSIITVVDACTSCEQLGSRLDQRFLYVRVDLPDHNPLIGVALNHAPAHSTQTVLY